jgi:hypothetical protein
VTNNIGICKCATGTSQYADKFREALILSFLIGRMVLALKFYANRKIIATIDPIVAGFTRVPGPSIDRDVLNQLAVPAYQKMGRYFYIRNSFKIGMALRRQAIGKKLIDFRPTILPRGQ